MSKMAMDALDRGWNLGLATGKVPAGRDSDLDLLVAEKSAQSARATPVAKLAGDAAIRLAARFVRKVVSPRTVLHEQH